MNIKNTDRALEIEVTNIAKSLNHDSVKNYLDNVEDESISLDERYKCYLIAFTFFRRMKSTSDCISLYQKNRHLFGQKFLFLHFYSIALKQTGRKIDLVKSISIANEALKLQSTHAGALHNLAGALHLLVENSDLGEKERKKHLDESVELVDSAIQLEPDYAKFYATRAKIQCLRGFYDSAEKDVTMAIDKEDISANDYSIRVSDYLAIKMSINLNKAVEGVLVDTKKEIQNIYDDVKKSNLEILSFFVAVISFVIGSITLAKGVKTTEAIQLILVLASSLLIVVSGFTLLFDSRNKFKRFFFSSIIGILIFVLAVYSPSLFLVSP